MIAQRARAGSGGHLPTGVLLATVVMTLGCVHSRKVAPPPASALAGVEGGGSGVPFAPAPEGLLRPEAVEAIQGRLHRDGFMLSAERTGRLDAPTREALRRFQAKNDLPATGLPSYRTVENLDLQTDGIFLARADPRSGPKSTDEGSVGSRDAPRQP